MTFNIGEQHAGIVNNVGGNQSIQHGQHVYEAPDPQELVRELRQQMARVGLPTQIAADAQARVDELESDLAAARPDRAAVASRLNRLTQILLSAGALASAGHALTRPLAALASWLGDLGTPIMQAIGG